MTDQPHRSERQPAGRIVRTATETRGAKIVLGKRGRLIWAGSFVVMVTLFVSIAL